MKRLLYILLLILGFATGVQAAEQKPKDDLDVSALIFGHIGDAYEWHIVSDVAIPLPCILYNSERGFDVFLSNKFEGVKEYNGYHIDKESGKIVDKAGVRPFDISITKDVAELLLVCVILCSVILGLASWYKRNGFEKAPGGFVGMMEAVIDYVDKDISKTNIGRGYEHFTPYLATVFFFILICNIIGLIPIFPGGANLTGNIAITMVLAVTSWIATNCFAPKAYFRNLVWPKVPVFLNVPIPIMPVVEIMGVFTKPFALTIRLFANIFAGHAVALSLTCVIFVTWQIGAALGAPMTIACVFFSIFMDCIEVLVVFVQAYVFTLLSSSFIGMARNEE